MRASVLLMCLLLTACGHANQPPNAPPSQSTNPPAADSPATPAPNTADPKPSATEPAAAPNPDGNAWRNLKRSDPEGWVSLSSDGRAELLKRVKAPPASFKYAAAITSTKAPGATESAAEWEHWAAGASGAVLYHVDAQGQPVIDAVQRFAPAIRDGDVTVEETNGIAWAELQEETVLMVALANRLGTYIVLGFLSAETDARPAHREAILQWAAGMLPE